MNFDNQEFPIMRRVAEYQVRTFAFVLLPFLTAGIMSVLYMIAGVTTGQQVLTYTLFSIVGSVVLLICHALDIPFATSYWNLSKSVAAHFLFFLHRLPVCVYYYRDVAHWILAIIFLVVFSSAVSIFTTYSSLSVSRRTITASTLHICESPLLTTAHSPSLLRDMHDSAPVFPYLSNIAKGFEKLTNSDSGQESQIHAILDELPLLHSSHSFDSILLGIFEIRLRLHISRIQLSKESPDVSAIRHLNLAWDKIDELSGLFSIDSYPAEAGSAINRALPRLRAGLDALYAQHWQIVERGFRDYDTAFAAQRNSEQKRYRGWEDAIEIAYDSALREKKRHEIGDPGFSTALNNYADIVQWRLRHYASLERNKGIQQSATAHQRLLMGERDLKDLCQELELAARASPTAPYYVTLAQLYSLRAHSAVYNILRTEASHASSNVKTELDVEALKKLLDNIIFNLRVSIALGVTPEMLSLDSDTLGFKWIQTYETGRFVLQPIDFALSRTRMQFLEIMGVDQDENKEGSP